LEISKVLLYPKITEVLGKAGTNKKEVLRAVKANSVIIKPGVTLKVMEEDPEDNKILECALAAGAKIVVSGDKHLLRLGKFKNTRILAPREFFDNIG
jgi:putative PIN family toxin of toxin-antitoxin system